MDSVDLDVLKTSVKWLDEGHQATLATIVRTWGSAPRPIGAMTVIAAARPSTARRRAVVADIGGGLLASIGTNRRYDRSVCDS